MPSKGGRGEGEEGGWWCGGWCLCMLLREEEERGGGKEQSLLAKPLPAGPPRQRTVRGGDLRDMWAPSAKGGGGGGSGPCVWWCGSGCIISRGLPTEVSRLFHLEPRGGPQQNRTPREAHEGLAAAFLFSWEGRDALKGGVVCGPRAHTPAGGPRPFLPPSPLPGLSKP